MPIIDPQAVLDQLVEQIEAAAREQLSGVRLDRRRLTQYIAGSAARLAAGDPLSPGYSALAANEARNVASAAANRAFDRAVAIDGTITGLIQGAITIAAAALHKAA